MSSSATNAQARAASQARRGGVANCCHSICSLLRFVWVGSLVSSAENIWSASTTEAARSMRAPACRYSARSEEHTSELQSLMRISYAVFCLKKKKRRRDVHNPPSAINNTTLTMLIEKKHNTQN